MFFSIVIPVYKTEKYLKRAVDSILNQKFLDYEVVLIDDGSPDLCGAICDEYGQRDPRIKVIHKKNEGVSVARNIGIEQAQGEYVCFVDSDDEMAENCLIIAYEILKKETNVDLLQMGWCRLKENDEKPQIISSYNVKKYEKLEALEMFLNFQVFQHAPWSKFIKRELFMGCKFPAGIKIGEDLENSYKILSKSNNILSTDAVAYYQWVRQDSAMMSRDVFGIADAFGVNKCMYEYFCKYEELRFVNTRRYANDLMQLLRDIEEKKDSAEKKKIREEIVKVLKNIRYQDLKDKKTMVLKFLAINMSKLYLLLYKLRMKLKK